MIETEPDIEIEPLPHQQEFDDAIFLDNYRYACLCTGLGGGKTYWGAVMAASAALNYDAPGCIISPDYTMMTDSTLEGAFAAFDDMGLEYNIIFSGRKKYLILEGRKIYLRSQKYHRQIRGLPKLGWIWIDETSPDLHKAMRNAIGRIRRRKGDTTSENWPMKMWITTTPNGMDYLYDFFVNEPKENPLLEKERWIMHGIDSGDNIHLDDLYLQHLASDFAGKWKLQEKGGQFVQMEGAVWEPYVSEPLILTVNGKKKFQYPIDLAIDFGRLRPAVLFITKLYDMRQQKQIDFIFDALMPQDILVSDLIQKTLDRLEVEWGFENPEKAVSVIYGDPAGDSKNSQEYISEFVKFKNAFDGCQIMYSHQTEFRSIEKGIQKVDNLFRKKELAIASYLNKKNTGDYTDVVTALTCLRYPEIKPGVTIRNVYYKDGTFDHPADACRYRAVFQMLESQREAS